MARGYSAWVVFAAFLAFYVPVAALYRLGRVLAWVLEKIAVAGILCVFAALFAVVFAWHGFGAWTDRRIADALGVADGQ